MVYKRLVLTLLILGLVVSAANHPSSSVDAASHLTQKPTLESAQKSLQAQAGFFTENKGQWDPAILFVGNTSFGKVAFTKDAVLYQMIKKEEKTSQSQTIKLSFVNPGIPTIKGYDVLPHYNNYFLGNDPKKWASYCRNYTYVTYEDVWQGIDLAYFFTPEGLKYEYYVAPEANIKNLQIKVEGATLANLGKTLQLTNSLGSIQDANLLVFDQATNQTLFCRFALKDQKISFDGIPEKRNNTIVIDPLIYSTYLGGNGIEYGNAIAVDADGNAYISGLANSTFFPTTPGAYDTTYHGGDDCFVTKLNPTGSTLVYSTYFGGTNGESTRAIAVDASGNAYITGSTWSADYPTTPGAYDTTFNGSDDCFVTKLNPTGSALIYSTYLGGIGAEYGYEIALDASGNAYITGNTNSSDFPTTPGAFDTSHNGGDDCFVTKLNPGGSSLVYSTYIGDINGDYGRGIAVDGSGNAHITGLTWSTDFPTTPGAYDTSYNNGDDCFVTKLNPGGTSLLYSTFLGGTNGDYGTAIALDNVGTAYVTGYTWSSDFPTTPGAFARINDGTNSDSFITKLNPSGVSLVYSTYIGGTGEESANGIAVDGAGNAYIAGNSSSTNYPLTPGAFQTTNMGGDDCFVTKLNPYGSSLVYSTYIGGSDNVTAQAIAIDGDENAFITGYTTSTGYPTTPGAYDTTFNNDVDSFVTKISTLNVKGTLGGNLSNNLVNLSWDILNPDQLTIQGYRIYRADVSDNIFTLLGTMDGANNRSYIDNTGIIGKTYSYYVIVLDENDLQLARSNIVTLGPIEPPPFPDMGVSLSGILTYNIVHLAWTVENPENWEIKGYKIYRANTNDHLFRVLGTVDGANNRSYIDNTGIIGKTYSYYVVVLDPNSLQLARSNIITLGPLQAVPQPLLELSIWTNKGEFCSGEEVLFKVTIFNQSYGAATGSTLGVTFPREIQYRSCDKYRGETQPSGLVNFYLGTIPGHSSVTFQINAAVTGSVPFEKSTATHFAVTCQEKSADQTTISLALKRCGGGSPILEILVHYQNVSYDTATGEIYLLLSEELAMDVEFSGFMTPLSYEIKWGDGTTDKMEKQTVTKYALKHQFTSKGRMVIQITATDATGRTKTVSLSLNVR